MISYQLRIQTNKLDFLFIIMLRCGWINGGTFCHIYDSHFLRNNIVTTQPNSPAMKWMKV